MTPHRVLARVCLVLLLVPWSTGQTTNFALNQPAFQYGIYIDGNSMPIRAVDGSLNQDSDAASASNCAISAWSQSQVPWWVVKLQKWIRLNSFTVYGRLPSAWDNTNYGYYMGQFWNDSLPTVVSTTVGFSGFGFTLVLIDPTNLAGPAVTKTITSSDVFIGRYFGIKSGGGAIPVQLCEVQVFGQTSLLSGGNSMLIQSDQTLYSSYNSSVLTDDQDETCLSFFGTNKTRVVNLKAPLATANKTNVLVLMKGSVQTDNGIPCQSGLILRVGMYRLLVGGILENYACSFASTSSSGASFLHTFTCQCANCLQQVIVWLDNTGDASAGVVQVCEVLAFAV